MIRSGRFYVVVQIHDQRVGVNDAFGKVIGEQVVEDFPTVAAASAYIDEMKAGAVALASDPFADTG